MPCHIEVKPYAGWPNCVHISNGAIEAIVTTDVGPRVIHFACKGWENLFCRIPETLGSTGGDEWRMYGGHRLWHGPEAMPRSYGPDNAPVAYVLTADGVHLTPEIEADARIQKEMRIAIDPAAPRLTVTHRLTNRGLWPVKLAAWPITVMASGGVSVVPQTRRDTGLLANRSLTLWPYTRMNDPRFYWGDRYIGFIQNPAAKGPAKFGLSNELGWAAYFNSNQLFIKRFAFVPGAEYPDTQCSYETYTCDYMMEMESLSPLKVLEPGEALEHRETWAAYGDVEAPRIEDEARVMAVIEGALGS